MSENPAPSPNNTEPAWRDVVGWTAPLTFEILAPFRFDREPRPIEFRRREFGQGAQKTRVESDGWVDDDGLLNVKYSRIQSAIADIATVMIYPTASPADLPIFAAEWVVIGGKCHALILDVETAGNQPPLLAQMENSFTKLGSKWRSTIPENRDRPEWFNEIATPWAVYGTATLDALDDVKQAFTEYLETTVKDFYLPRRKTAKSGPDHPAVTAYKEHHFENSPGRPLLKAKGGAEWTDTFLADWHFGPSMPPV